MEKKEKNKILKDITALKNQILKLEKKLASFSDKNKIKEFKNRLPRVDLNADIEAIGDFDILKATGIEISEGGISFEMEEDLPFEIQFYLKDELFKQRAHLVWLEKKQSGGNRCGFRFIEPDKLTDI